MVIWQKRIIMKNNEAITLLKDFISIESVSADTSRRNEINKAVDFLTKQLKLMGFEIKLLTKNNSPPLILGTYHLDHDRRQDGQGKTIGIYGHYDVQPEDPVNEWETPPFKLT